VPTLRIDHKTVTVPENTTVLDAARGVGIEIPTLCFLPDCKQSISCQVCLVKIDGRMFPACATKAADGMEVESESSEVRNLRKTALELLLSDHVGDCYAPCQFGCPTHMDIPAMLRAIREGDIARAIRIIKNDIAFPAVLGWICSRPCEKVCRRKMLDQPVTVCQLKRYVAETDLGDDETYFPELLPKSGKSAVVIGAGPAGLSAAYYLTIAGHAVTLYEKNELPGGRMRLFPEDRLPLEVLEAEIDHLLSLPIDFRPTEEIPIHHHSFQELAANYDAVILASGAIPESCVADCGLVLTQNRPNVTSGTYETSLPKVFAAGTVLRPNAMIVRSIADGKEVAGVVDVFLRTGKIHPRPPIWSVRTHKPEISELEQLTQNADMNHRYFEPSPNQDNEYSRTEAMEQAARCLHCDCRAREKCRLFRYSREYGAKVDNFQESPRRKITIERGGDILFEHEKCIKCGLCVTITREAAEPLGLTFIGRGFEVRVSTPFDADMETALAKTAQKCIQACPTAAISSRQL